MKSRLILAPMAGISDLPFRMINRAFGCELAFCEMLNVRSTGFAGSKKTKQMLSTLPEDRPLGIQILGVEPVFIHKALAVIEKYHHDLLDFNAACPVRKVVRRGEGAGLLQKPKILSAILKLLVKESSCPVTIKIRIGWDKDSVNAPEIARLAEDAGVAAIFVHGRTKTQEYSGCVDYETIGLVKKEVKVPVVASGDIFNSILAKKMLDETGSDGLMVARGALGNPWIFGQIEGFLKTGRVVDRPDKQQIVRVMKEHLAKCTAFYGERSGVIIFRKFFGWYTLGLRKIRPFRERATRTKTEKELVKIIEESCADN